MPYIPVSIVQVHIQQLTTLAVAESTSKSYARGWCMFKWFAEQYHVNMNSIKEHNLLEFISFLSLSGFAASTVQLYLTGVRHHLKLQGRNSFKDSFVIKMVVKGVSSRYLVPDIRLPINIALLHDMWNVLSIVVKNPYMVKLYRSMFTLAYHGLLRPGEVTYTPHAIKVQHVYFVYENVHLYLHSSKAKTGPFPQKVVVAPQPGICLVTDLHTYLQVRPCIPGALFRKENGLPVHYHELLDLMDRLAKFLDLPTDRFKPHSFCIGATTDLHLKGYSSQVIQKKGRWSSAAFQRYIRV